MRIVFKWILLVGMMTNFAFTQNPRPLNPLLWQMMKGGKDINELEKAVYQNAQAEIGNKIQEAVYTDVGKFIASVTSVIINNRGTILAAGYNDGQIKFWNLKTGGIICQIAAHNKTVSVLKFSNNDSYLASGSEDKVIKIWDVASGTLITSLTGHNGTIKSLAFSHNGSKIASGSSDKIINIWSLANYKLLTTLFGHTDTVNSLDFSNDDGKLASAAADSSIEIWNTATWQTSLIFKGHKSSVLSAVFFPDGIKIASGGNDSTIRIWNSITGEVLNVITGHKNIVNSIIFPLDGKRFFSGSYDVTVKAWDCNKYTLLKTINCPGILSSITIDGSRAALMNGEAVSIYDLDSNRQINILSGHSEAVSAVALSNDGKLIASGSWDKTIKIWDVASGNLNSTFFGHTDGILSLAFSPDGERLVSAGFDKLVKVWAVKSGTLINTMSDHSNFVWNVSFSPDGSLIASSDWDNVVKLWETASGRLVNSFSSAGNSVAFSPDGKRIVTGGLGLLKMWDVTKGSVLKDLSSLAGEITSIAFSPDGTKFVVGGIDRTVQIWDAVTYTRIKNISGLSNSILSILVSKDGSQIVTGGGFAVSFFDIYSGNLLKSLTTDMAANGVKISGDGKIMAVTRDRYIRMYDYTSLLAGKTITGKILYNGSGLSDVTINVTGSNSLTTQTDQNGMYSFILTSGGTYSLNPVKKGYTFSPATLDVVNFKADLTGNFSTNLSKYTISGKVLYNNLPLSNASVSLNLYGVLTDIKVSDQQGKYSFTVDAINTYTITPAKTGYIFQPSEKTYFSLMDNQTQDFTSIKSFTSNVKNNNLPEKTMLNQNYPNPFNPSTKINYSLSTPGIVDIRIYDLFGKEVETLIDKYRDAGYYTIEWKPNNLASGVYYCHFKYGNISQIDKMVYVR